MTTERSAPQAQALSLCDRLSGRPLRVLITRPADSAHETAELVHSAGGEALVCPCLFPTPPADEGALAAALFSQPRPNVVAFTSRYAVRAVADSLARRQPSLSLSQGLADCWVAAVGPRTAEALADEGRPADLISQSDGPDAPSSSAAGLAQQLVARFAAADSAQGPVQVLFPRAAEARPTLPAALRQAGLQVIEVEAYRMRAATPTELAPLRQALQAGEVDLAPFGSPRSVAIALSVLPADAAALFAAVRVGAIGETTAAALREAGLRVDVVSHSARFDELLSGLAALPR
ncbi:MAG TPA: uroporphyrinogen-III synthase [Pseudomonadota bacterium]|nr:uroporphyrinogen-III synthase [Pseudomonadota bacterium]